MCLGTFSRRGTVASATIYPCAECASSRKQFYRMETKFPYDKNSACRQYLGVIQLLSENSCMAAELFLPFAAFPRKGLEKYAPFRYNQVIWADFAQIQVDLSKNVAAAGDNSKREGIMEIQLQNLTKKFPNRTASIRGCHRGQRI